MRAIFNVIFVGMGILYPGAFAHQVSVNGTDHYDPAIGDWRPTEAMVTWSYIAFSALVLQLLTTLVIFRMGVHTVQLDADESFNMALHEMELFCKEIQDTMTSIIEKHDKVFDANDDMHLQLVLCAAKAAEDKMREVFEHR